MPALSGGAPGKNLPSVSSTFSLPSISSFRMAAAGELLGDRRDVEERLRRYTRARWRDPPAHSPRAAGCGRPWRPAPSPSSHRRQGATCSRRAERRAGRRRPPPRRRRRARRLRMIPKATASATPRRKAPAPPGTRGHGRPPDPFPLSPSFPFPGAASSRAAGAAQERRSLPRPSTRPSRARRGGGGRGSRAGRGDRASASGVGQSRRKPVAVPLHRGFLDRLGRPGARVPQTEQWTVRTLPVACDATPASALPPHLGQGCSSKTSCGISSDLDCKVAPV